MNAAIQMSSTSLSSSQSAVNAMTDAMEGFGRTTLADLLQKQEELVGQRQEIAQIDDVKERAIRTEILESDMKGLTAKIDEYRDDVAELIAGLEAEFNRLGHDLSNLQKPTQDDLALIQRAVDYLQKLEHVDGPAARKLLTDAIAESEASWNPIGREARVGEAKNNLATFDAQQANDVAAAKVAVEEAKAEVARLRNKRIREADFDSQFERFIAMSQSIQGKLLLNVKDSEARLISTRKAVAASAKEKEEIAKLIAASLKEITTAEDAVMDLESQKNNALDQETRAGIETKLVAANETLAELNGRKNEMQTAYNALEASLVKDESMLDTIQVQRENQRAHARKLMIDSKQRFTQAQNLVTVIKNTAQEDAASKLHAAGSKLDRMALEMAARALMASERERIKLLTGHEADIKAFAETTSALAEGRAKIAIEDAEIAARMQTNYGVNPLDSSWLHLAESMGHNDQAGAPAPAQ